MQQSKFSFIGFLSKLVVLSAVVLLAVPNLAIAQDARSTVTLSQDGPIADQLHLPIYQWTQPDMAPRGVVLAAHGLAMHGKSFDVIARKLASQGFIVVATDMRGYGRYLTSDHRYCERPDCKLRIDYDKSFEDIAQLAGLLKEKYPSLPLFGVGESLGGSMLIRLAATSPQLVDGLILSAPALKHQNFLDPYFVLDAGLVIAHPHVQISLVPFVRRYVSDDPRIIEEKLADPLMRKHLSAYELVQSSRAINKTTQYIANVPASTPVLVIQGSGDRIIKADGVMLLLSRLRSNDQTIKWFHERGHILLETDYVQPDTMEAVVGWLGRHVNAPEIQARCNRNEEFVARHIEVLGPYANARQAMPMVARSRRAGLAAAHCWHINRSAARVSSPDLVVITRELIHNHHFWV